MKLSNFMQGLEILRGYYANPDGYHIGADHDVFYADKTDKPLRTNDVQKLIDLGWFQEGRTGDSDEMKADQYDPEEGWTAFT